MLLVENQEICSKVYKMEDDVCEKNSKNKSKYSTIQF